MNDLEPISRSELTPAQDPQQRPPLLGIELDVYARRDGVDSGGDTSRGSHVIVVGTVDCSKPSREPVTTPVPDYCQRAMPSKDVPAVWLVVGRPNKGGPYLVPARPDGGPDMSRRLRWGGNFASTTNPFFWELVGTEDFSGIRIFDRPSVIEGETRLDIA